MPSIDTADIDDRLFSIRDEDFWIASASGGSPDEEGHLSVAPDELAFELPSQKCRLEEDTGFNGLGVRCERFLLIVVADTVSFHPRRCVLRIDD